MTKFFELKNEDREKMFKILKAKMGKSWTSIAKDLGISRAMLFNYLSGKFPLRKEIFDKIMKVAKINIGCKIISKNSPNKEIISSKLTEKFAEVIGALAGDGHVSNSSYEVSITCSRELDTEYIKHLKKLFDEIFGIEFKIIIQDTRIRLKTYSKKLVYFLNENYGIPLGEKVGNLRVPPELRVKNVFLRAYIRGLFDTDGSIYLRRKKDPVVEIINIDKAYLNEIKDILMDLGIPCGISGKNLYIYKKEIIKKFFNEIKPANSKHLKKYANYFDHMHRWSNG